MQKGVLASAPYAPRGPLPLVAYFIRGRNIQFQISEGAYSWGASPVLNQQGNMPPMPHGSTRQYPQIRSKREREREKYRECVCVRERMRERETLWKLRYSVNDPNYGILLGIHSPKKDLSYHYTKMYELCRDTAYLKSWCRNYWCYFEHIWYK